MPERDLFYLQRHHTRTTKKLRYNLAEVYKIFIMVKSDLQLNLKIILSKYYIRSSIVRYPRYLDTYRRYLRDDKYIGISRFIAKVTIYRGI